MISLGHALLLKISVGLVNAKSRPFHRWNRDPVTLYTIHFCRSHPSSETGTAAEIPQRMYLTSRSSCASRMVTCIGGLALLGLNMSSKTRPGPGALSLLRLVAGGRNRSRLGH
ncbi:hypothetical protein F5883DRAFT_550119 [Diaporthe sp. PMI_573]|nr:hypothetical protein F5883DRAFT_550119 [Diaporthaceae sp. PMI_573]